MNLQSVLNRLENIRVRAENKENISEEIMALEVIDLLLDYIGNEQLKKKVDEIPL